jgi:MFS family permease
MHEQVAAVTAVPRTTPLGPDGWPARRFAWTTVTILAIAQGFNAVDRHLINLLVGPIKADLHITDAQVGLLLGLSFAIFYTTVGVPIGRLADTYSRRIIITLGTAFWSLSTAACGLAQSFGQLFTARVAVGAGEATLNPSGYSMISDLFPPERRATPMGVFIMGHTLGQALVLFGGGVFVSYLLAHQITIDLPTGHVLKPWQIAFVCAGLPGLLIAVLALTMREPERREVLTRGPGAAAPASVPIREVGAYLAKHSSIYLPIIAGFAFVLLWHMGNTVWAPTFLMRTFGYTPAQVGAILGVMTLMFNSTGVVAAGWISEYLARRGYKDAHMRAAFYGTLCAVPFGLSATLVPHPIIALVLLGLAFFFGALPFALAPAAIAGITPNQMRAQITAIYLLCVNLFGFGLGPWFIGTLTDRVFENELLLRYSVATTAALALPLALIFLRRSMTEYQRHVVSQAK